MKEGPDIARIAALIGEPARANMLTALLTGKALTATELSHEAGVTLQSASSHLSKLEDGGLLTQRKQGRHKYFALANDDVGQVIESLSGFAARSGHMRTRTGPKDPELRRARVCYNHLAGKQSVQMYDYLLKRDFLQIGPGGIDVTQSGAAFVQDFGIDLAALRGSRTPLCRECLDWSERRTHLAGSLGRALFKRIEDLGWAKREQGTRIVRFSKTGEAKFADTFGS